MKLIKLFPSPHVELRVHVSDEMAADLKQCRELVKEEGGTGKKCESCSWTDVEIEQTGMCEIITTEMLED